MNALEDNFEGHEKPPFQNLSSERESSFWRLKSASDRWRENRLKRVLAQEKEPLLTTVGRTLYLASCLLFDGLVLLEIPVRMGKTPFSWAIYFLSLATALKVQKSLYNRWFALDIDLIEFSRN